MYGGKRENDRNETISKDQKLSANPSGDGRKGLQFPMRLDEQKSHPFETRSPYECIHCFSRVRIVTLVTLHTGTIDEPRSMIWRSKKLRVLSVRFCNVGVDHLRRIDDAVELVLCDKPQLKCGLLQREIVVQRVVRNLRCLVIANDR